MLTYFSGAWDFSSRSCFVAPESMANSIRSFKTHTHTHIQFGDSPIRQIKCRQVKKTKASKQLSKEPKKKKKLIDFKVGFIKRFWVRQQPEHLAQCAFQPKYEKFVYIQRWLIFITVIDLSTLGTIHIRIIIGYGAEFFSKNRVRWTHITIALQGPLPKWLWTKRTLGKAYAQDAGLTFSSIFSSLKLPLSTFFSRRFFCVLALIIIRIQTKRACYKPIRLL